MLAALADRQQIADELALFCERVDAGDLTRATEAFTKDCVTDFGPGAGGPIEGRQAFLERIRVSQGQYRQTHHQLGQIRVELGGDEATSVAYVDACHRRLDDSRYDAHLQYHDTWARTPAGWRIRERRAFFSLLDGAVGDQNRPLWLPRRSPPR